MNRQEGKVKRGAAPYLEAGEDVVAAVIARPRGWTLKEVGGPAGPWIGGRKVVEATTAGVNAGLALASPMALLVTTRRVMVLKIGSPIGWGLGGEVKGLVSSLPISAVDQIKVRRLLLGKVITVIVAGEKIKVEVNAAADAGGIAGSFAEMKAAAA
jgi:hypothetical protein